MNASQTGGRLLLLIWIALSMVATPDRVRGADEMPQTKFTAPIPPGGLTNIFALDEDQLEIADRRGRLALLDYPAKETTLGAPYNAISRLYGRLNYKPLLRRGMARRGLSSVGRNWSDIYSRAGLVHFPQQEGSGAYFVPFPHQRRPATPMGFAVFRNNHQVPVFTLSCASCHTRNLFGRPVLGGSNLMGATGDTLLLLKKVSQLKNRQYRFATRPNGGEMAAFHALQHQVSFVHGKPGKAKGLENPVAFVGISMAGRANDAYATRRHSPSSRSALWKIPTDTKPPVLWNLRYKNRFQHDGSMSGDPMLANLIFNEIGRGADLKRLDRWIDRNRQVIRDLSASAYAMEAPRWTDFFSANTIDLAKAKRGELVFENRCAHCHGHYEKAWSTETDAGANFAHLLKTVRVIMPPETTAKKVGTDSGRSQAMVHLAPLANGLEIFKKNNMSFTPNPGAYVPPPLVGIWARWPYFHNNSIPNLDELLKPAPLRVKKFHLGPAHDIRRDYDATAVGFPVGDRTPRQWRTASRLFDTSKPGLANTGHDEGIFVRDGVNLLSPTDKLDLIEFLKTL